MMWSGLKRVSELSPWYDALAFVLLNPYAESAWYPELPNQYSTKRGAGEGGPQRCVRPVRIILRR